MPDARSRILSRLRAAPPSPSPDLPDWAAPVYEPAARLDRFRMMFEAMKAEVHDVDAATWPQRLRTLLDNRGVRTLLHGDGSPVATQLAAAWSGDDQAPASRIPSFSGSAFTWVMSQYCSTETAM
jgi:L-lactate dehydrogenase complex protein LldG